MNQLINNEVLKQLGETAIKVATRIKEFNPEVNFDFKIEGVNLNVTIEDEKSILSKNVFDIPLGEVQKGKGNAVEVLKYIFGVLEVFNRNYEKLKCFTPIDTSIHYGGNTYIEFSSSENSTKYVEFHSEEVSNLFFEKAIYILGNLHTYLGTEKFSIYKGLEKDVDKIYIECEDAADIDSIITVNDFIELDYPKYQNNLATTQDIVQIELSKIYELFKEELYYVKSIIPVSENEEVKEFLFVETCSDGFKEAGKFSGVNVLNGILDLCIKEVEQFNETKTSTFSGLTKLIYRGFVEEREHLSLNSIKLLLTGENTLTMFHESAITIDEMIEGIIEEINEFTAFEDYSSQFVIFESKEDGLKKVTSI